MDKDPNYDPNYDPNAYYNENGNLIYYDEYGNAQYAETNDPQYYDTAYQGQETGGAGGSGQGYGNVATDGMSYVDEPGVKHQINYTQDAKLTSMLQTTDGMGVAAL